MRFVDGRTPDTQPSYHQGGWVKALPPDDRRSLWFDALGTLGNLHRSTIGSPLITRYSRETPARTDFAFWLSYWENHYAQSAGDNRLSLMVQIAGWLRNNEPRSRRCALCWGDARIGNMIFDEHLKCAAMIDWELFSIGDPTQDLAYCLYSDDHFVFANSDQSNLSWPTHEESVARYEEAAGFPVDRQVLSFYRIYSGYWIVCTLSRLIEIQKRSGNLPAETNVDERFTPVAYLRKEWESNR